MSAPNLLGMKLRGSEKDRESAKKEILIALRASEGVLPDTATKLGIGQRTISRFLDEAELQEEAARIRAKHGRIDYRYVVHPDGKVTRRVKAKVKKKPKKA